MPNVHRRLAVLERRPPSQMAVAHAAEQRYSWSGRFAAHSPANAALVQRILSFRLPDGQYGLAVENGRVDSWSLFLIPLTYCDIEADYPKVRFPINPTPEAAEARTLYEEMVAAAEAYDAATGESCPFPVLGQ